MDNSSNLTTAGVSHILGYYGISTPCTDRVFLGNLWKESKNRRIGCLTRHEILKSCEGYCNLSTEVAKMHETGQLSAKAIVLGMLRVGYEAQARRRRAHGVLFPEWKPIDFTGSSTALPPLFA